MNAAGRGFGPPYPSISIVTPSLNQAKYIAEAIRSVATQSYPAHEHLVMDGGSDDGTIEVLRQSPSVTWTSGPDSGQSDALNKGFLRAYGDIVGWLNADDRYLPGALAAVAAYFRANPRVDVVYGDINWIDRDGALIENRPSLEFSRFSLRYSHYLTIPSTAAFFRSEIVHAGILLNPEYHYAMDYDFFLRVSNAGYRFVRLPVTLAEFRLQPESKSSQRAQQQLNEHGAIARQENPLLKDLPPPLQSAVWQSLSRVARGRRIAIRAARGHYRSAMRPGKRPDFVGRAVPWDRGSWPI